MRRAALEDAPLVNAILNHPTVRPTIEGTGLLDATALIADRRNICVFDDRGGAMFAWRGPGVFEGHSFFIVRGREAIRAGKDALEHVEGMIWGLTPQGNKPARWFNRQVGFTSRGMLETPDGVCELFVLEK